MGRDAHSNVGRVKPVLCVRHQASAPLGVIEEVFADRGVPWRYIDAWKRTEWPDPQDGSGVIVLGGEMNADELDRHPFLAQVRTFTASAVEARVPFLGICLGAQILARALDASVVRAPVREIGFRRVRPTSEGRDDPLLDGFGSDVSVFQWHEDTFNLPRGATHLFASDDVLQQAFRFDNAYGVQWHFEVTEDIIAAWCDETPPQRLNGYWGVTKDELVQQARDHLPAQRAAAEKTVARWLDLAA